MNLKLEKKSMTNFVKINKEEYKELLNKTLFKTFFHDLAWHEFLEKEFKWLKFEHYLYGDEFLLSFGRVGNKLISLPFCEYGGPLPLKNNINFAEFKKDVLEKFKNIKLKIHPSMLEAKLPTGSLASRISTHWLDLKDKSEKELLASFRKTLRHSIKKAHDFGLEIKKCQSEEELKKFYNLYVDNLRKKKTVPYPFSVIRFLYQKSDPNLQMHPNDPNVDILLAYYKNKIIAGDIFLHYNGFVHYFISASDYKYRDLGASYLILWEKIKSLIGKTRPDGRGFVFDLGASPKGSALEIFKRGWGGKEYPILQLGIQRSEEGLRSSKLRNIWGLLPNFVVKKLSPYLIKYRI